MVHALVHEIELRKNYLEDEMIETIYFGGGTPSLLEISDFRLQVEKMYSVFQIDPYAEITIETNPDDITEEKLAEWKHAGINRLSIGIQSFFDEDLLWMNRAHTAEQAIGNLQLAKEYFSNITIDLIYGTPQMTIEKWKENVARAISFDIPHLSCYALTVEEKTPLHKMIRDLKAIDVDPDKQSEQFLLLMEWMEDAGYEHYEISNFAKPGFRSRHNSSYWQGKNYIGIGPSAHSFNGTSRQWNVSNNNIYIESIQKNIIPFQIEILTETQKLNEYIMTALRTAEGINLDHLQKNQSDLIISAGKKYLENGLIKKEENYLKLTSEGKLLADGIASDLFV